MSEIQDIRLQLLKDNFRNKKQSADACMEIKKLIESNQGRRLEKLLRNHYLYPITTDEEVRFRDNTDFLIGYYGLLSIGILSGYLSNRLNDETYGEAYFILSNQYVKKYYQDHYKLYLPQLLMKYLDSRYRDIILPKQIISGSDIRIFEDFLVLLRSRMDDDDINEFLWFLDDGTEYDKQLNEHIGIDHLWNSFKDEKSFKANFKSDASKKRPLGKALIGFTKFLGYLHEYETLLRRSADDFVLQPALWHTDAYWFNHLKNKLGDVLQQGISNLKNLVDSGFYSSIQGEQADVEVIEEWRIQSNKQISDSMKNVEFLFNKNLGQPLLDMIRE